MEPPQSHAAVRALSLVDFRCFDSIDIEFAPGLTVLAGSNGEGKTSVLEAVGWMSRGKSFRRVPESALVRAGADSAVIRAEISAGERRRLVEVEMRAGLPARVQVDRSTLARRRDLVDVLRVTVFSPDDLELVKGAPSERREYLDDLLVSMSPRHDAARTDFERVLKQRNALLKGRRLDTDGMATLDVFDVQLARAGAELVRGRLNLVARLLTPLGAVYDELSNRASEVRTLYVADWWDGSAERVQIEAALAAALQSSRSRDSDRGVTTIGPHRDEWRLGLGDRDARTQASQGEQRSLALAMRLAGHLVVREVTGVTPVLLLDDVFSELDAARSEALVAQLPAGQALLTTAARVPDVVAADRVLRLAGHRLVEAA